jgi:hypothetical protein
MRCGRALVLSSLLCLFALGGCAGIDEINVRSPSFLHRLSPGHEAHNSDLVSLEVALVERPIYDTYLDKGLWDVVDERVDSLPARGALKANGFRVGEIGGITPPELLSMLTSDRSCSNPREIGLHSGGSTTLSLGPNLPTSHFEATQDNDSKTYQLDKAQFDLIVTPTLTNDGRTCLKCTPQVTHGEEFMIFRPVQGGWIQRPQRQIESFAGLSWEITVAPNEFVVIGGNMEKPDSLGHQCFIRPGETPPVRRLLVIRSVRALPEACNEPARAAEAPRPRGRPMSIAEQAAQSGDGATPP